MAKDGTNRGGARIGAGAKKKPLADKIAEGNLGKRTLTVIDFDNQSVDLEGQAMPKPSKLLSAKQKDGKKLVAADIYKKTWDWLHEGGRCSNKDIPERVLREACAAALDLEDFDEDIFLERVDTIQVLDGQVLEFHFYDGTISQIEWISTAKKDCWTEEHKDRQREWMRNYMANATDGRYSEFTTRIRCEHCGSTFRRNTQPSKSSNGGKMHYWRCPTSGDCVTTGIREDRLKELTSSVMGLVEHDAEAFKEQVECISVAAGMMLTFHFFDGREESVQYNTKRQGTAWTPERREKFKSSMQGKYTEKRRQAMSENMKRIRSEKHWSSKRK